MHAGHTTRTLVFILSEQRSGSTWLSYVLGSHPDCAHLGEYHRPFTQPGHVACRLCEARGLTACIVLHGIEAVARDRAFDFAFDRCGVPILIDASKTIEWTDTFVDHDRYAVRIVHLLRDPRGWFVSQRRREPLTAAAAVSRWVGSNEAIADFVASRGLPCRTVFYDELTARPDEFFPPLSRFIGSVYEPGVLEYWQREHHGLGGNGAAFNLLGDYDAARLTTGDDAFYQARARTRFHDTRWLADLAPEERRVFDDSPSIDRLLRRHGRDLRHFDTLLAGSPAAASWWRSLSRRFRPGAAA